MPAEDLPPVTFGIKVTKDLGHVHFDVFAGRNLGARGRCGSLVMRGDEFGAFLAALNPDTITSVEGHEWSLRLPETAQPVRPGCVCELHEVGTIFGPPEYVRGLSNGCTIHPASAEELRQVAAQRAFDEADRAAREAARRAE